MNSQPVARRSRSLYWKLAAVVGIPLALAGLLGGLNYLTAPSWSKASDGHPALVGYWQGTMIVAAGDPRQIRLELTPYNPRRNRNPKIDLDGQAKECAPRGRTMYSLTGDVAADRGSHVSIGLGLPAQRWPGRHLSDLKGTWDGQNLIHVEASLSLVTEDGTAIAATNDPVVRFELHRADKAAYDAPC